MSRRRRYRSAMYGYEKGKASTGWVDHKATKVMHRAEPSHGNDRPSRGRMVPDKTVESKMKSDTRPVLIGMNNPVSSDPSHALFPSPEGCTGHRLYEMLRTRVPDVTRKQYLDAFARRNLVPFKVYSPAMAAKCAAEIEQEYWGTGRTIVLLGLDVVKAFRHPRLLIHPQLIGGATWRQIPHPSGRNLWFNDAANRQLVAMLLEDLFNAARVEA